MSDVSDSSLHEGPRDIVEEYENEVSDGGQASADEYETEDRFNNENEAEESKPRRIDPATSKTHIVRNPQPKLNTERLKGPKGVHTLEKYFDTFKFHGKGHEKADLDRVMKRIEHWAHRLFPKLDYDDFLARVEVLGSKKDLQVFIKKYRMDMISIEDDISREVVDREEDEKVDDAPIDEFDMLIEEQIEKQKQAVIDQEAHTSVNEDRFNQLLANTNTNVEYSQLPKENSAPSELSDEIKERIERNRQQAIQRRQARLQQLQEEAKKKKQMEEMGSAEVLSETTQNNIPTNQIQELTNTAKDSMDENMLTDE